MSSRVTTYQGHARTERGPWYRAAINPAGNVVWSGDSGVTESGYELVCDDNAGAFAGLVEKHAETWRPHLELAEGAIVTYEGVVYRVRQAHTTQSDWAPDKVLALFERVGVPTSGTPVWAVGTPYKVGDIVTYQGSTYKCLQAHTSQADWTPSVVPALWQKQ